MFGQFLLVALSGKPPVPKLQAAEIPEGMSIKKCLDAELRCSYELCLQNLEIVRRLLEEGETNIDANNVRFIEALGEMPSSFELKSKVLLAEGI